MCFVKYEIKKKKKKKTFNFYILILQKEKWE